MRDHCMVAFVRLHLTSGTSCSTVICGPGPVLPSARRFDGSSGCVHEITSLAGGIARG